MCSYVTEMIALLVTVDVLKLCVLALVILSECFLFVITHVVIYSGLRGQQRGLNVKSRVKGLEDRAVRRPGYSML